MAKEKQEPAKVTQEITEREGFLEVTRVTLKSGEVESETAETERIKVKPFLTNVAVVSVKAGATVNLGNYESARVDVMLSVPCYVEEIDRVYNEVQAWVDQRIEKEYEELRGGQK